MMGTMVEDMTGVISMEAVGMREQQKQRRWRKGINEGLWEINFGVDRRDDEIGGRNVGQWRWRFGKNKNGVDSSWQGW